MKKMIALSAVGLDRPGIVAAVTGVLYNCGCNLEESSMTILHNDFAMIVLISLPESLTTEGLIDAMQSVTDRLGLTLNVRELSSDEIAARHKEQIPNFSLSIYGSDKPGIVYRIAQLLADRGVNIVDLETQISHSRNQPLYSMILDILVPDTIDEKALSRDISVLCKELAVDFSLETITYCDEM